MKDKFKNKKIVIGVIIALLLVGGVSSYFIYDNYRITTIKNEMVITFADVKEVEYGTKDFDIKKELVQKIENAEIKDFSKLDTSVIGQQTITFTLVKNDVKKEVKHKITVVDTKAPIIELETESKELTINDEYDFMSNIKEVEDEVDGEIKLTDNALEINKKATEEYNKLNKENITDDTKVADTPLKDFLIEDIEGQEEKRLSLKNCYYIDGNIDTSTVGEYKINITAIDKNGLITNKTFNVIVKEKEVVKPTQPKQTSISNSNTGANNSDNSFGPNSPDWEWGVDGWNDEESFHKFVGLMTKERAKQRAKEMGYKDGEYTIEKGFLCGCGFQSWAIAPVNN